MPDPFDDPDVKAWVRSVREDLIPKITDSALTVSIVPTGETDVKFAVELGMSIMLDKPIIAIVHPGTKVPDHLTRVADEILEGDIADPRFAQRVQAAISRRLR